MKLNESIALIKDAIPFLPRAGQPQHWADLGCGTGLFTEALVRILPAGSIMYGVDTHPGLPTAAQLRSALPTGSQLHPITADFEKDDLPLKDLDGILMANSFHYVVDKPDFLAMLNRPLHRDHPASAPLQPGSPLLIVEYDTDTPVPTWVPWPVSFVQLRKLLVAAGWPKVVKLGQRPSAFGRSNIYAALALTKIQ